MPLPPVHLSRMRTGEREVWSIRDDDESVNVDFYPEGGYAEKMNLRIVRIDYRAPFGRFSGWIRDGNDRKIPVDRCFGMGERKRFRL